MKKGLLSKALEYARQGSIWLSVFLNSLPIEDRRKLEEKYNIKSEPILPPGGLPKSNGHLDK